MPSSRSRWLPLLALVFALIAGCATFPDSGPRDWREKPEDGGALAAPPRIPDQAPEGGEPHDTKPPGKPQAPNGCEDQDPLIVATCLDPVSAIAILPSGESAYVAQRATGRISRVEKGKPNQPIATVPVDAAGGGLKGLVLSPSYAEDQLLYALATTPTDQRLIRVTTDGQVSPVLTGIPRTPGNDGGGLAVGKQGELLVATPASAGASASSLDGKVLRVDVFGKPFPGNPLPGSPILSTGLTSPGGVCTSADSGTTWVTDRTSGRDALYKVVPGPLGPAAWNWPDRPGVAGCAAMTGHVAVALRGAAALFVLQTGKSPDSFTGVPTTSLQKTYGRLSAAAVSPARIVWLGTENKGRGGPVVSSDDRVLRLPLLGGDSGGSGPE